jgi:hypothetical protein
MENAIIVELLPFEFRISTREQQRARENALERRSSYWDGNEDGDGGQR